MDDAEWFADHDAYLRSAEWKAKRQLVFERAGFDCQAELPGCRGSATQVHHLTYKHWRSEPLFDLVAVCASCHEQITVMDRQQRPHGSRMRQQPGMDIPEIDDLPIGCLTGRGISE